MSTPLTLHVSAAPTSTLVRVTGELDLVSSPELRECVVSAAKDAPCVLLDLSEVTFIDSTGVGALIEAQREAFNEHSWIGVIDASKQVGRVLRLAGAVDLLGFTSLPATDEI